MNKLVSFVVGAGLGAAVGAAVSSLMAPQSGQELQYSVRSTMEEAKVSGEAAEGVYDHEERFRERFRAKVGDPTALTERA